jgi:hypothetical protein
VQEGPLCHTPQCAQISTCVLTPSGRDPGLKCSGELSVLKVTLCPKNYLVSKEIRLCIWLSIYPPTLRCRQTHTPTLTYRRYPNPSTLPPPGNFQCGH